MRGGEGGAKVRQEVPAYSLTLLFDYSYLLPNNAFAFHYCVALCACILQQTSQLLTKSLREPKRSNSSTRTVFPISLYRGSAGGQCLFETFYDSTGGEIYLFPTKPKQTLPRRRDRDRELLRSLRTAVWTQ